MGGGTWEIVGGVLWWLYVSSGDTIPGALRFAVWMKMLAVRDAIGGGEAEFNGKTIII